MCVEKMFPTDKNTGKWIFGLENVFNPTKLKTGFREHDFLRSNYFLTPNFSFLLSKLIRYPDALRNGTLINLTLIPSEK